GRARRGGLRRQRAAQLLRGSEECVQSFRFNQAVGDRFGVAHSNWPSFGTTKKPSLKAGANLSGPNARGEGATSSGRKRMASGPGTNVFTVPFVGEGSALNCATSSRMRDICSALSGHESSSALTPP